jgi:RND family efflux transporter MFP subunit
VQSRRELAEADLEMWRDRSAWSERMSKKGYLSPSQVQAERSKLRSAELALGKVEEEMRVLDLTKLRETKDRESKVQEAERALERVEAQSKAKEIQAMTDKQAKESVAKQEQARHDDILEEIAKCTVHSPQDGMVVYYVAESSFFSSSRQSIVAQGEPVSEGQKLMRIPDLRHMLVSAKVHEALVSRVHNEQPAVIRVDAFPSRMIKGRVKNVATVASQADRYSSDVKVYTCMVALDEYVEGLKPGMSAEVTILVGNVLENVLTIPVHAIIGSAEMGKERRVWVMTPNGPEERKVTIGLSNDKMAEVRAGLEEGDQVILNPKAILGEAARVREAGAEKMHFTFEGGPPLEKKQGQGPPDGKRPPATGKGMNKKKGPMSAE